jgi:hypothetical protein
VPPDLALEPGTPLLAFSQGRWWRATVVAVEGGDRVVVCFPGWDPQWRARLPRKHLQIDPDPLRQPIRLPPEGWRGQRMDEPRPDGIQPADDQVQHKPGV